jgi:inorganic pyrophosphatase
VSDVASFPLELDVVVEVARWSLIKRSEGGRLDLISPLPCPFNYGSVLGTLAADGEREDALLLGPRLAAGSRVRARVVGRVRFLDAGLDDAKWVCSAGPLGLSDRALLALFFALYARVKGTLNALRGVRGATRYLGIELASG